MKLIRVRRPYYTYLLLILQTKKDIELIITMKQSNGITQLFIHLQFLKPQEFIFLKFLILMN